MGLFDRFFGSKSPPSRISAVIDGGATEGAGPSESAEAPAAHEYLTSDDIPTPSESLPPGAAPDQSAISSLVVSDSRANENTHTSETDERNGRKIAAQRLAITLRRKLTEQLLYELETSHLEIASLCEQVLANRHLETTQPETRKLDELETQIASLRDALSDLDSLYRSAVGRLEDQQQLKLRINELASENLSLKAKATEGAAAEGQASHLESQRQQLDRRLMEVGARERRLSERESTVLKNFEELQRRERGLLNLSPSPASKPPESARSVPGEIRQLQAQLQLQRSEAQQKENRLTEKVRDLRKETFNAQKERDELKEQLQEADQALQKLLKEKNLLERSLAGRGTKSDLQRTPVKTMTSRDATLLATSDRRIIDWMLEDASPDQAAVEHGYISIVGNGPWKQRRLEELMEDADFDIWELPEPDIHHVVVGRTDWDASKLEEQIDLMAGQSLYIYSQEMWFAKLVTGRDPFDSEDHDLLMAFADGHPALQYLISRELPWPEVTEKKRKPGGGKGGAGFDFKANSPLSNFGYQVGATRGLSQSERRKLLAEFLEANALVFDDEATAAERLEWGKPNSTQRLLRLAAHLKWLIEWQGKSPQRAQANEEWRSDLQWLKKTHYKPTQHKFRWPGV
jgi:hypothetical protein